MDRIEQAGSVDPEDEPLLTPSAPADARSQNQDIKEEESEKTNATLQLIGGDKDEKKWDERKHLPFRPKHGGVDKIKKQRAFYHSLLGEDKKA